VAIAVVVDGGGSGIESMAPMVALSMVAVVDGGGNNGIFTTASQDDDRHPHPYGPCPCPPLDKDQRAGWRVRREASHSLLSWLLPLVPSLSLLMGEQHQG
jgi:hypothetical protein